MKSSIPSIVRLGALGLVVALSACSDKTVREQGAELAGKKIDIVAGVGDQLQAKGAEAGESLTAGVGKVVKGIERGVLKSGRNVALDPAVGQAGLQINQVGDAKAQSETGHALEAYVIANNTAAGKLQLYAYDALDREIGRSTATLAMAAGEAKYVSFPIDQQVDLNAISRVRLAYASQPAGK
jgi:hypothetical protein